jgi:hypothetical protein
MIDVMACRYQATEPGREDRRARRDMEVGRGQRTDLKPRRPGEQLLDHFRNISRNLKTRNLATSPPRQPVPATARCTASRRPSPDMPSPSWSRRWTEARALQKAGGDDRGLPGPGLRSAVRPRVSGCTLAHQRHIPPQESAITRNSACRVGRLSADQTEILLPAVRFRRPAPPRFHACNIPSDDSPNAIAPVRSLRSFGRGSGLDAVSVRRLRFPIRSRLHA